ncbi:MAG: arginine--tRNA ligase [Candidatus Zixiibacteriota bacterium]
MSAGIIKLQNELIEALDKACKKLFDIDAPVNINPADPKFGDFQTNLPFILVKKLKKAPILIGKELADEIEEDFKGKISIEVVGGFMNFTISPNLLSKMVRLIIESPKDFIKVDYGQAGRFSGIKDLSKKIQLEYVSANPTGPMNIVSARAAAVGDTLSKLMANCDMKVFSEYYINDAGNQIDILGKSFLARLKEVKGEDTEFPENGYHGDYLIDYAKEYLKENDNKIGDNYTKWILNRVIRENRKVLEDYNVIFDGWFSEKEFRNSYDIQSLLERFGDDVYKKDGALWFKGEKYNNEIEDFVLVKSDGQYSYRLIDIAYNLDKLENRGFERAIIILGPDHHGHVARMQAAMESLGYKGKLEILILQQVNLFEGGEKVKMSKRAGKIIMMKELVDEVGSDVARYFFLTRKMEAHLDFDLDLAKKQGDENPVYYIQYAHARIANVILHAKKQGVDIDDIDYSDIVWDEDNELEMMHKIARFPSIAINAMVGRQPHLVAFYLHELAQLFHPFYFKYRIVSDDKEITKRRLILSKALKNVFKEVLGLLGISAPESM